MMMPTILVQETTLLLKMKIWLSQTAELTLLQKLVETQNMITKHTTKTVNHIVQVLLNLFIKLRKQ